MEDKQIIKLFKDKKPTDNSFDSTLNEIENIVKKINPNGLSKLDKLIIDYAWRCGSINGMKRIRDVVNNDANCEGDENE